MVQKEARNDAVSIAKGIAIILMVMGHAQCPLWLWSFIYMFHMPLFFFFSGFCFKKMYLDSPWIFAKKRVMGIYWPYVKWGIVFLLLHNVLFHLNIYNGEFGFRGEVSRLYDLGEYISIALSIVTRMKGEEQLLGAYWFLHTLFFGSFIFYLIIFICKKLGVSTLFGWLLLPFTMFLLYTGNSLPYFGVGSRETLASLFMLIGYWYKKNNFQVEEFKPCLILAICALLVALGSAYWPSDMFSITLITILPYILTALVGILMVFILSKRILLTNHLQRILVFIGNNTPFILTWHFFSFKIVSMLIIRIYSLPITRLAEFPVIEEYAGLGWWLGYMTIGICLPTLLAFSIDGIRKKCNSNTIVF